MPMLELRFKDRILAVSEDEEGWLVLKWGRHTIWGIVNPEAVPDLQREGRIETSKWAMFVNGVEIASEGYDREPEDLDDLFRMVSEQDGLLSVRLNGETIWDWTD